MSALHRPLLITTVLAAVVGVARAAPVETSTTPYPGVTHVRWTDTATQQRAHLVVIDLSFASITVRATDEIDRGKTTSQLAAAHGAQLAINGDLFAPAGFVPDGLAVGTAGAWTSAHDDGRAAVLRFGKTVAGTDALIIVPESVVAPADLPAFVTGAIGGRPMIVRAGQVAAGFDCGDTDVLACQRAPRTAVGLSTDRRTMTLAVVDGWQAGAVGMTAAELAALLAARGVRDALLLDGGSSSTLYIAAEGGVVNAPSDGSQRVVANHLTFRIATPVTRTLFGVVREGNILSGPSLGGVRVRLDHRRGRQQLQLRRRAAALRVRRRHQDRLRPGAPVQADGSRQRDDVQLDRDVPGRHRARRRRRRGDRRTRSRRRRDRWQRGQRRRRQRRRW